ncbi:hypothetical protein [Serratia entomophila]|uniref:hypothetical protein n=1 Tax=Serratia entomophila TaxID=42906 RepID=UPI0021BD7C13|nr:hypothetical protein [Serratia entomophila]
MSKAQMVDAIMGAAVRTAIIAGKNIDTADMFFTLAFKTERELKSICKKLGI